MTQFRTLSRMFALSAFVFSLLSVAAAFGQGGDKATTITVTGDPNAQLQALFKKGTKATAAAIPPANDQSPQTTQFKIEQSVFGTATPPDGWNLYYCEPNGPYVAIPPGPLPDEKDLPCPKDKLRPLAAYIPAGSSAVISKAPDGSFTVSVNGGAAVAVPAPTPTTGTVTPAPTTTPAPGAAAEAHISFLGFEVGGTVGAKDFAGVNGCGPLQSLGASSCKAEDHKFAGGVFGGFTLGRYVEAMGSFNDVPAINRNGSIAGAAEHSSDQTKFETITGRILLPIGAFAPFVEGGVAFVQSYFKENESIGTGSTSSSLPTSFHINTTNYVAGGGVKVHVLKHLIMGAHVQYLPVQKGMLVNEHNIIAGFDIGIGFGRLISSIFK